MISIPSNMRCPYCNNYSVEKITQMNPYDYNMQEKYICTYCGREVNSPNSVTYSNSTDGSYVNTTSNDKYCQKCNTKMEPLGDNGWWSCPKCSYGYMDYIGDLPKQLSDDELEMTKKMFDGTLHIPCDNTSGIAVGKLAEDLMSNTIQFDRCERIIFRDKTLDFIFEIPEERYKDIDTIIINGHKFVRDKNDLEC